MFIQVMTNLFKKKVFKLKKWLQKSIIITVAFLTFGLISPNHLIWEQLLDKESPNTFSSADTGIEYSSVIEETVDQKELLAIAAKEQSYIKFGHRIGPVIQDEFEQVIFPRMQEAIDAAVHNLDNQSIKQLGITETPSGDYHERIFHIFDEKSKKDIIRFHVRTDKKPLDGYYFNFHYHLAEDYYAKHYVLGEIYWSKNTPPKWLS